MDGGGQLLRFRRGRGKADVLDAEVSEPEGHVNGKSRVSSFSNVTIVYLQFSRPIVKRDKQRR